MINKLLPKAFIIHVKQRTERHIDKVYFIIIVGAFPIFGLFYYKIKIYLVCLTLPEEVLFRTVGGLPLSCSSPPSFW
jgi:hypothetical protein